MLTREQAAKFARQFSIGDVVEYEDGDDWRLAIVTVVRLPPHHRPSLHLVGVDGEGVGGPGLVHASPPCVRHRMPRARVEVPEGALGNRGWNREQAVRGALRHAGLLRGTHRGRRP